MKRLYHVIIGPGLPNTGVALGLARSLGCSVETLFSEEAEGESRPVDIAGDRVPGVRRLMAAHLRGKLTGVPITGKLVFNRGLPAADALLEDDGRNATVYCPADMLDKTILLFVCDPAFSILGGHVARAFPGSRVHCCFASSYAARPAQSRPPWLPLTRWPSICQGSRMKILLTGWAICLPNATSCWWKDMQTAQAQTLRCGGPPTARIRCFRKETISWPWSPTIRLIPACRCRYGPEVTWPPLWMP